LVEAWGDFQGDWAVGEGRVLEVQYYLVAEGIQEVLQAYLVVRAFQAFLGSQLV
jgi:hypothetical protein